MRLDADIALGTTSQSLYLDVSEGKPDSVTSVEVFNESDPDTQPLTGVVSGTATVDAVNSVLIAAAGASTDDPRLVSAVATQVVVGRSYLIAGPHGEREWVEVISRNDASVVLRSPLLGEYPVGTSSLRGTRITQDLSDAWLSDSSNLGSYRVRWVYSLSGAETIRDGYFSVVRYPSDHEVTPARVDDAMPGWRNSLPTHHREDEGRRLIETAYRGVVVDLRAYKIESESLRDPELVDELVIRKTIANSIEHRVYLGELAPELMVDARQRYDDVIARHIRDDGGVRLDHDGEGGARESEARRIFIR